MAQSYAEGCREKHTSTIRAYVLFPLIVVSKWCTANVFFSFPFQGLRLRRQWA